MIVRAPPGRPRWGPACETAVRTLRLFADILADEAANLVLKTMALGGLFIGGGLAPRLLPPRRALLPGHVRPRRLHRDWLRAVPIQVVRNPQAALTRGGGHGRSRCRP